MPMFITSVSTRDAPYTQRTHAQVLSVQPSSGQWHCVLAASSPWLPFQRLLLVTEVFAVHVPFFILMT